MWTYQQTTGTMLDPQGKVLGQGYSGSPAGKNDPTKQSVKDVGPIPCGQYSIGGPEDTATHGPFVLPLTPDPANTMFGRAGFLIHGDSLEHPGAASEGCIILGRPFRNQIWSSGDRKLVVTA